MKTAVQLVANYRRFAERENLPEIVPGRIVNDVAKTTFNYSMEEPILREFGSYFEVDHPYSFSTLQPCIRTGDFVDIRSGKIGDHASLFHIFPADFRMDPRASEWQALHRLVVGRLVQFLFVEARLDPAHTFVTCFGGGRPNDFCPSLVERHAVLPADTDTIDTFLRAGVPAQNIEQSSSAGTFLVTFAEDDDFYSGCRYEVFADVAGRRVEVATGEALFLRQVREGGQTVALRPMEASVGAAVLGLERLLVAINQLPTVFHCDHIQPLWQDLTTGSGDPRFVPAIKLVDALRAAHLIWADTQGGSGLNSSLKERLRAFIATILDGAEAINLDEREMRRLLLRNAELQPWLPQLSDVVPKLSSTIAAKLVARRARTR